MIEALSSVWFGASVCRDSSGYNVDCGLSVRCQKNKGAKPMLLCSKAPDSARNQKSHQLAPFRAQLTSVLIAEKIVRFLEQDSSRSYAILIFS
jgi:hypothetical protein